MQLNCCHGNMTNQWPHTVCTQVDTTLQRKKEEPEMSELRHKADWLFSPVRHRQQPLEHREPTPPRIPNWKVPTSKVRSQASPSNPGCPRFSWSASRWEKYCPLGQGFSILALLECWDTACALWDIKPHLWSLPTRCQWHLQLWPPKRLQTLPRVP